MKSLFSLIFIFFTLCAFSIRNYEHIKVGLFWDNRPTSIIVTLNEGAYDVYGDGEKIMAFPQNKMLVFKVEANQVVISNFSATYGSYQKVMLRAKTNHSSFNIKPNKPSLGSRIYPDHLNLSVYNSRLKLINNTAFDKYLAGVVRSEAGNKHTLEYYKVQSIISRTYALKHWYRYKNLGFNLCDRVNSQVYHNMCYDNETIVEAVKVTEDIVIVDHEINLITAVFHSNSGGKTLNSEDVWTKSLPYLKSKPDSFSFDMPHFDWKVTVSKSAWLNYFQTYYHLNLGNQHDVNAVLNFCPEDRITVLQSSNAKVELTRIRSDFGLKSTFFCVNESNGKVEITGKGYGHGVGLSQEGAMRMAVLGYPYTDILHHYYTDVHLIKLSAIDFFKGE